MCVEMTGKTHMFRFSDNMSKSDFETSVHQIRQLFRHYSAGDLAASLFVADLWLPNSSSMVKHLLFAGILGSTKSEDLAVRPAITCYADFTKLIGDFYRLSPSFPIYEDFVLILDWGSVKYPLGREQYRIFYGDSLENPYDFLTSFEFTFRPLDDRFVKLLGRSPMGELKTALQLQAHLLADITMQPNSTDLNIEPGHNEVPPEEFWQQASSAYARLEPATLFGEDFVRAFSIEIGAIPEDLATDSKIVDAVFEPGPLSNMFFMDRSKPLLVLPRRMNGTLFDRWGLLLADNEGRLPPSELSHELDIAGELFQFLSRRFPKDQVFPLVSAVTADNKPHDYVFSAALRSQDHLVLLAAFSPATDQEKLGKAISEATPKINEARDLLKGEGCRLFLHIPKEGIEARTKLSVSTFVVVPPASTGFFKVESDLPLPGRVCLLPTLLAILDELDDLDTLSDFLDYIEELQDVRMSPMTSLLDKFASYQDSHGVLIPGASKPDFITLDPHWGTEFRYRSLAQFWSLFPGRDFGDGPRGWRLELEGPRRLRMHARSFFCSVLHCRVGATDAFFTAPFDHLPYEDGRVANFLMECVEDGFFNHEAQLRSHPVFGRYKEFEVIFFPASLALNPKFKHLAHLAPGQELWKMDFGFPSASMVAVRVMFNVELIQNAFTEATDRSVEVALLVGILGQLDKVLPDEDLPRLTAALEAGAHAQPRFKFFEARRPAAFPEFVPVWIPRPHDFKLAKRRLAELAKAADVGEGQYDLATAKTKLNILRGKVVEALNQSVERFGYAHGVRLLMERADSLTHRREQDRMSAMKSVEHQVDYSREEAFSGKEQEYLQHHRNYRYLIEKFVQFEPRGRAQLDRDGVLYLLALTDWLFVIQGASDSLHYEISPVGLKIDHDFLLEVDYDEAARKNQADYSVEEARSRLGLIGRPEDEFRIPISVEQQISDLDAAFLRDFGYRFTSLIGVLMVLTHWPIYTEGAPVHASYSATDREIEALALKEIPGFDSKELTPILKRLRLRGCDVIRLINDPRACADIPVWEHNKRDSRYTIRPLIKLGGKFVWAPYATRQAGLIWSGYPSNAMLPAAIGKAAVSELLLNVKRKLDGAVETQALDIIKRHTARAIPNALLHRLDKQGKHPPELGDYDVLAYLPEKNILLNVECKNLSPVYCLKDSKRLRETIFGEPGKDEGHFEKIDRRRKYLEQNGNVVVEACGWAQPSEPPRVSTLYVTPRAFLWTRFPPRPVQATFVRLEELSDTIASL